MSRYNLHVTRIKPHVEFTPHDWDPIKCGRRGESQKSILPPAALRLWDAQVHEIKQKDRFAREYERLWTDE